MSSTSVAGKAPIRCRYKHQGEVCDKFLATESNLFCFPCGKEVLVTQINLDEKKPHCSYCGKVLMVEGKIKCPRCKKYTEYHLRVREIKMVEGSVSGLLELMRKKYIKELKSKKYVVLPYPEEYVCDSPEKAVGALDELGLCMNWAIVTSKDDFKMLVYQGWVYRHSCECFVKLPFYKDCKRFDIAFKRLLKRIFAPFVLESDIHRSVMSVTAHPKEKDCFFVTLNLIFRNSNVAIAEVLDEVDDGHEELKATVFWLD